jgi:hypothetical protein
MSQTLTVKLSDELYTALQRHAEASGTSPADLAARTLEQHYGPRGHSRPNGGPQTEAEKQKARERFERHFGGVNLGYATGTDNEEMDADLAREYADNHEQG